jgi:protein SCO1/2
MYRIVYLLLSSLFFFSCNKQKTNEFSLPYYNEPTFTPIFLNDSTISLKNITHKIGNFSFLNEDSVLINQNTIDNKIHIANFIFTSCGSICPTMTKNLKIVSDSLSKEKDLVLLSYSVTPWIDKPYILKKYKEKNEISNKNWHFVTGNKADIYTLARQSYFAEEDIGFSKDSTEFLHTEHFILVDKTKRIRGVYNGTLSLEMQQLIADFNVLKKESK